MIYIQSTEKFNRFFLINFSYSSTTLRKLMPITAKVRVDESTMRKVLFWFKQTAVQQSQLFKQEAQLVLG